MYLARGEPLGVHCSAIRHILRARGDMQLLSSQSFALWRTAHHRLLAHQIFLREFPDRDQIDRVRKLNVAIPSYHIYSDILNMSILCASVRSLCEGGETSESTMAERLQWAERLSDEIRAFLASIRDWLSGVSQPWRPNVVQSNQLRTPQYVTESTIARPPPSPASTIILQYQDIWLTYMWNCEC